MSSDTADMSLVSIVRSLYAGEGIGRMLMNREIARSVELSGIVLDIGGKGQPSYLQYMKRQAPYQFVVLDVAPDRTVNTVGSVTHLPFMSHGLDCILCFNVLEHVFDYALALSEARRVLKPGGTLYGRVPFLFGIHADPHDHWRYTKETLVKILTRAGFAEVSIETQGGLFLAILNLLGPILRIGVIRVMGAVVAIVMNRLLSKTVGSTRNQERYPLGYFFVAR